MSIKAEILYSDVSGRKREFESHQIKYDGREFYVYVTPWHEGGSIRTLKQVVMSRHARSERRVPDRDPRHAKIMAAFDAALIERKAHEAA